MTRLFYTTLFTAITATAAHADPGHLDAAGHGHSHWLGYGILADIAAVATAMWIARALAKTKSA